MKTAIFWIGILSGMNAYISKRDGRGVMVDYTYVQIPSERFEEILAGDRRNDVCKWDLPLERNQQITLVRCGGDRSGAQHSLEVVLGKCEHKQHESDILPPGYTAEDLRRFGLVKFEFELDGAVKNVTGRGSCQIVLGGM